MPKLELLEAEEGGIGETGAVRTDEEEPPPALTPDERRRSGSGEQKEVTGSKPQPSGSPRTCYGKEKKKKIHE